MKMHFFAISGITESNLHEVSSGLSHIGGAKPLQGDKTAGLYMFVCISFELQEAIATQVTSVLTGTGAYIMQANSWPNA